jgi:hypothetical protein
MHRAVPAVWLLVVLGAMPVSAQEPATGSDTSAAVLEGPADHLGSGVPTAPQTATCDQPGQPKSAPWQPVWGLSGLRIFPAGPKVAPNGEEYHPFFTFDLDFNLWLWPREGVYLFADLRFWGEKAENGVTNNRDGGLGFSKRQFDLQGGLAWNWSGPWEARLFGYSLNNLNRGVDLVTSSGFNDGAGVENRYYLSPEYAKLGQPGFDVARATFVSAGYYLEKDMVGNDGQPFNPGLMLRAYLTCDLEDWPAYAFCDTTYISTRSLHAKLLLFDVGVAARPFDSWRQWEFRLGVENTADFQVGSVLNLWYVSLRYVF